LIEEYENYCYLSNSLNKSKNPPIATKIGNL